MFFALVLASLFARTANAQPAFSCTSSAGVPPLVRSQGIAEFVGDVVLTCTGGVPTLAGNAVPLNNIQIYLNVGVTSRLLAGTLSEALLIIDEPNDSQQRPCTPGPCAVTGQARKVSATGITPLDYLLDRMSDVTAEHAERLDAAKAAAPYIHSKMPTAIVTPAQPGSEVGQDDEELLNLYTSGIRAGGRRRLRLSMRYCAPGSPHSPRKHLGPSIPAPATYITGI